MTELTVLIPTRNEADNVAIMVARLDRELADLDAEILFVDDSTDHTPDVIATVAASAVLPVRLLHRPVPRGRLAGAVVDGVREARSPWVVVMDGDLQHPPEVVPALYERALTSGADVVVGSRYLAGGASDGLAGRFRHLVSRWSGRTAKSLFPRRLAACTDPMSGFFAVRRDGVDLDAVTAAGYKILLALLVHRRLAVAEVPFAFAPRHAGESKASVREGLRYLRLLLTLRAGSALRFAAVGASGVLPNVAAVALLVHLGVHYLVAAAIATQVAIAWNFAGAELLVFHDRRLGRMRYRASRFVVVSEADLLRLPFVALLVDHLGMGTVVATVLTLLLAFALRYALTSRLVYGRPALAAATAPVPTLSEAL